MALDSAMAQMRSKGSHHKKTHQRRKAYNQDGFQHVLDASTLSELVEDCGRCGTLNTQCSGSAKDIHHLADPRHAQEFEVRR